MSHDPKRRVRGTYIGVSECTRREEYDGIGGGSKWGVSIHGSVGLPHVDCDSHRIIVG